MGGDSVRRGNGLVQLELMNDGKEVKIWGPYEDYMTVGREQFLNAVLQLILKDGMRITCVEGHQTWGLVPQVIE